jgi:hypothetical protein
MLHAVRAIATVLILVAGCAFGVGPVAGISRKGPTFGVLGGGGPGNRWYQLRGEVGVMVETGGDSGAGAYPVFGTTALVLANPDGRTSGGAFVSFDGSRDGYIYGGGGAAVRWSHAKTDVDCREHGWLVTIGIRRTSARVDGVRTELFVWPQYVLYSKNGC